MSSSIPVVIPTHDNPTFTRNTLRQLCERGIINVIVVDNASTYPPMLEYLDRIEAPLLIRRSENLGPWIWQDPAIFDELPQHFALTDPDLEFNPRLPPDFIQKLTALTERFKVGKAGFALEICDSFLMRQDDFEIGGTGWKIWDWEQQFWKHPLGTLDKENMMYLAPIDTTFAVYNKAYFDPAKTDAVRVSGNYTCRHLPWYRDSIVPREEREFYAQSASKTMPVAFYK
jgi:hypothetical protein